MKKFTEYFNESDTTAEMKKSKAAVTKLGKLLREIKNWNFNHVNREKEDPNIYKRRVDAEIEKILKGLTPNEMRLVVSAFCQNSTETLPIHAAFYSMVDLKHRHKIAEREEEEKRKREKAKRKKLKESKSIQGELDFDSEPEVVQEFKLKNYELLYSTVFLYKLRDMLNNEKEEMTRLEAEQLAGLDNRSDIEYTDTNIAIIRELISEVKMQLQLIRDKSKGIKPPETFYSHMLNSGKIPKSSANYIQKAFAPFTDS
jgi:hypothetical protein